MLHAQICLFLHKNKFEAFNNYMYMCLTVSSNSQRNHDIQSSIISAIALHVHLFPQFDIRCEKGTADDYSNVLFSRSIVSKIARGGLPTREREKREERSRPFYPLTGPVRLPKQNQVFQTAGCSENSFRFVPGLGRSLSKVMFKLHKFSQQMNV